MKKIFNCVQILVFLLTLSSLGRADSDTDYHPDIDDYQHDDQSDDATTTSYVNGGQDYFGYGYVIKTVGLLNVTLNKSQDESELIIKATIGNDGLIRREETVEEVLFEIVHSEDESVDDVNKPRKKQWLLIQPPGDVDVAVIHWERNGDSILISAPIPNTNLGSSEATNSTEILPPIVD